MRRLTWTLEVEDDQEVPETGTLWDIQNDTVQFLDASLASVEDIPDDDADGVAAERGQRPHYNNEGHEIQ